MFFAGLIFGGALLNHPSHAAVGVPGNPDDGRFIFQLRCAGCHGGDGTYLDKAASLAQVNGRATGTLGHGGGTAPFQGINTADLAAWVSSRDTNVYSVAGLVADAQGLPVTGAVVTVCSDYLGYTPVQMVTAADGGFRLDGLPRGDHLITPSLAARLFAPSNWVVTVLRYFSTGDDAVFIAYGTNDPPPIVALPGRVQHVRPDGDDYRSGHSWLTAKRTISAALMAVPAGGEIWVVEGSYAETLTVNGIALYGGFTGGEVRRGQRDWRAHPTILDGDPDLLAGQGFTPGTVVTLVDGGTNTSLIDGFTLQNGSAQFGGGIRVGTSAVVVISHCLVRHNYAAVTGGGIYCDLTSAPVITHSVLQENASGYAGALYFNYDSRPVVANNLLVGNRADSAGGIACDGLVSMANNTIVQNLSADGSGVLSFFDGSGTLVNNLFAFNSAGIDDSTVMSEWRHNLVFGNTNWNWNGVVPDPSELSADPLFVDAANGDFHLRPDSPCVDAGDDTIAGASDVDLDDSARRQRTHVDIGAYELPPPRLSISQQDGYLVISWPAAESGFALEQGRDFGSPGWQPAPPAATNGELRFLSLPVTNSAGLFRLRKP